jgi:eukaryotic-like serine/threonine-protein kinase
VRRKQREPEPLPVPLGSVVAERYRLERVVGSGGMGVVAKATRLDDDSAVAIKFIKLARLAQRDAVQRFHREAGAAAQLESPHAVRVFEIATTDDGTPFVVMEFLEGQTFAEHLQQHGPLPIALACRWLTQVCSAISEAHRHGIIHRDLKPQNLFARRLGSGALSATVLDFGLAKSLLPHPSEDGTTSQNVVLGSPSYMSPEQIRWQSRLDHRTDIWSLGVVLHELVTGGLPFEGSWSAEIFASVLGELPKPMRLARPDVPGALEAVVARCLRKDPAERFASAEELGQVLADLAQDGELDGRASTSGAQARTPIARSEPSTLVEHRSRERPR